MTHLIATEKLNKNWTAYAYDDGSFVISAYGGKVRFNLTSAEAEKLSELHRNFADHCRETPSAAARERRA